MITAPALPTEVHALLTILGEGMVVFLLGLIGSVYPWFLGKPISTKRYIALGPLHGCLGSDCSGLCD